MKQIKGDTLKQRAIFDIIEHHPVIGERDIITLVFRGHHKWHGNQIVFDGYFYLKDVAGVTCFFDPEDLLFIEIKP